MIDSESMEEMRRDMEQESYYESRKEAEMRRDYEDGFLPHIEAEIEVAVEAIIDIAKLHEHYGWECSKADALRLIEEYL